MWVISSAFESKRYDYVCIDIISKYPSFSFGIVNRLRLPSLFLDHDDSKYLLGLAILPSIADAATVAGDAKYTFDESAPILPTKFLDDDDIQISFSPKAPR
jgi:hypothetical protein